jgi:hypothetical protein
LDLEARKTADDFLGGVLRLFDTNRDATRATDGNDATDAAAGPAAVLDRVLDDLYANTRARPYLRDRRPRGAELVMVLDEAETLVVDQLADEG